MGALFQKGPKEPGEIRALFPEGRGKWGRYSNGNVVWGPRAGGNKGALFLESPDWGK
jgi:hypothetical protein